MTLEAAKELDKHCVLNWLNEVYVTPSRAFDEYTEDELKMFAHDAIVLLEEQKVIDYKPTIDEYGKAYCICGENVGIIPSNKNLPSVCMKYCPECGRRMKWG